MLPSTIYDEVEDGGFVELDEASNNDSLNYFRSSNKQRHSVATLWRCSKGELVLANWTIASGNFEAASDEGGTNGGMLLFLSLLYRIGGQTRSHVSTNYIIVMGLSTQNKS
ncbi:unnamed protein product [Linum trigynum]|uniref:Uncharacterized protein n=1 Tax=Linum trigynum TaxID=586398 RepID=A0AAV2CLG9_9ROSI